MKYMTPKSSPRDVFLYLLAIITLYINVWRFIDLLFEYINVKLPDQLYGYYANSLDEIRLSIASLIVVFPVYIALSWYLRKDIIKHPEKREMKVRKWLLHLTLFLASITIIVDVVTLVNNFLRGELTLRFVLKVFVVLFVSAAVFSYYLWDLKRKTAPTSKPSKLIAALVSAVILASIAGSFFLIGSPAKQRSLRLDENRVNDLQMLQNEIIFYWRQKKALPVSLNNLKNDISGFLPPVDPATNLLYGYKKISLLKFELCANFNLPSLWNKSDGFHPQQPLYREPFEPNWWNREHGSGSVCFERTIDPELYRTEPLLKPMSAAMD